MAHIIYSLHTVCCPLSFGSVTCICTVEAALNSLWPSDTIWRNGTSSTLVQVMACGLTAQSEYLDQLWVIARGVARQIDRKYSIYQSLKWVWILFFLNYCHSSQWPMSERVNYLLFLVITQKLSSEVPWISWSVLEQRSATVQPSLLKTIYHTYCHKVFAGVGASIGRFDIQKVNETPKDMNVWMNWFIPLNRLCNIRENDTKLNVHFAWRKALGPTVYPVVINICMSNLDSLEPVVIQFRP